MIINPWTIGAVAALLASAGIFTDKAGEGIDSASNGVLKLALAAGVGFVILRQTKVI